MEYKAEDPYVKGISATDNIDLFKKAATYLDFQ